ncbi:MAG: hypothetical protein FWE05_12705 [Defluviitaleaceae bacterium]|nr:hypothetical protein [Defluviitaleaceae bacterium]
MYTSTHYFFESAGLEFESLMVDVITKMSKREWGAKSITFSTTKQDRFEGTDIFVLGVPMDITLAFSKKNRMKKLGSMVFDGVTVEFGLRFGNAKANFKTPVLVIGVETAIGITKSNMYVVLDTIKENVLNIINDAMDAYLVATEA